MKLKKTFLLLTLALVSTWAVAQEKIDYSVYEDKCNFYIANDLGRNGYYDQKPIAELMGVMAEEVGPECVIAAGDIHHFEGVISVQDPLWMTNYELIYAHPELMIAWYPICGNHEYRGATQAVVDYSRVSRRWEMPGRYYTKSFNEEGTTVRIVWIDTTPLRKTGSSSWAITPSTPRPRRTTWSAWTCSAAWTPSCAATAWTCTSTDTSTTSSTSA